MDARKTRLLPRCDERAHRELREALCRDTLDVVVAFDAPVTLGAESVVVIGSALPDLPVRLLDEAFAALRVDPACVVLGPAVDGGYYLVGMRRAIPSLFEGIDWGTTRVLAQTLDAARAADVSCALLEPWRDIDDASDLERLVRQPAAVGAARTRAWCERQSRLLNDR